MIVGFVGGGGGDGGGIGGGVVVVLAIRVVSVYSYRLQLCVCGYWCCD